MKKSSITTHYASLELPFSNSKALNQIEQLSNAYLQPTEELTTNLNRIGQEYPFCVYYKEKTNDPL
jgi:hypothetical protein